MRTAREQRVTLTASIERPVCFERTESIHINSISFNQREQTALAWLLGVLIAGLVSFGGFLTEALPELKYNLMISSLAGMTMVCLAWAVITKKS